MMYSFWFHCKVITSEVITTETVNDKYDLVVTTAVALNLVSSFLAL